MNRWRWLGVWLLEACSASLPAATEPPVEAPPIRQDAGQDARPARALDAGMDVSSKGDTTRVDASRDDASSIVTEDAGRVDGGPSFAPPVAAPPCGEDLSFVGGKR